MTRYAAAPQISLRDYQQAVIEALSGAQRMHIDELTRTLGWDQGRTGRTLTLLEVVGTVRQWPGMCYSLS